MQPYMHSLQATARHTRIRLMPVTEMFRVREVDGTQEHQVIGMRPEVSRLDRRASLPRSVKYRLADGGGSLDMIDLGTFEIVKTGKRVRRIS